MHAPGKHPQEHAGPPQAEPVAPGPLSVHGPARAPHHGREGTEAEAARGKGEPLQPPGSSALPAPPAGRGARGSAGDAQHTAGRALAHLSEHLNLPALYDRAIQLLSCPVGICASFKSYKPKTL